MEYDKIKDVIAVPMRRYPLVRRLAFKLFELGFLRVRYVKRELRRMLGHRSGATRVFDVGFGFGPFTDYMLRHFANVHVTGLEIKDDQVQDSLQFFHSEGFGENCDFIEGDICDYQEKNRHDVAIAIDIMEHIEDDVKVMRNIRDSLNPGGVLLIHTPRSDVDSRTVEHDPEELFVSEHVRDGYSNTEIEEKLLEAGFSRVEVKYTYFHYGMISWWLMQGIPLRLIRFSKFLTLILPVYLALVFPFAHRLMIADMSLDLDTGKGLLVRAYK